MLAPCRCVPTHILQHQEVLMLLITKPTLAGCSGWAGFVPAALRLGVAGCEHTSWNKDRPFVRLSLNFIMLLLESLFCDCLKNCKVQSKREVLRRQLVLFSSCLRCCVWLLGKYVVFACCIWLLHPPETPLWLPGSVRHLAKVREVGGVLRNCPGKIYQLCTLK